jgi:hypothetical protein
MADPNIVAPSLASVTLAALRVVLKLASVRRGRRIKRIHGLAVLYELLNYGAHHLLRLVALAPQFHNFNEAASVMFAAAARLKSLRRYWLSVASAVLKARFDNSYDVRIRHARPPQ